MQCFLLFGVGGRERDRNRFDRVECDICCIEADLFHSRQQPARTGFYIGDALLIRRRQCLLVAIDEQTALAQLDSARLDAGAGAGAVLVNDRSLSLRLKLQSLCTLQEGVASCANSVEANNRVEATARTGMIFMEAPIAQWRERIYPI